MSSFTKLIKAKTLLGLNEKATLQEIKLKYKNLMRQWHPDKHQDDIKSATQMSASINEAYETVLKYTQEYEFPFDEENLQKKTFTAQEWWEQKFGTKKDTI
ncbi:MAG: J domain-containing protein [Campylobacterota bacterium]|nr:J domain-containing protein [Campylobacterota bacterium]